MKEVITRATCDIDGTVYLLDPGEPQQSMIRTVEFSIDDRQYTIDVCEVCESSKMLFDLSLNDLIEKSTFIKTERKKVRTSTAKADPKPETKEKTNPFKPEMFRNNMGTYTCNHRSCRMVSDTARGLLMHNTRSHNGQTPPALVGKTG